MRIRSRAAPTGVLLLAGALVTAACTTQGLNFREDTRVEITSPRDREEVTVPFELQWAARDFDVGTQTIGGGGNYFAVFLGRAPMAPGQHLRALGDDSCKRTPGCPDEQWLADRFIFVTTETSLHIDAIPDVDVDDVRRRDLHEITIVLMDGDDRRIGESAFTVEYYTQDGS